MEFINYYSIFERYNTELMAGVSTTTISFGMLIVVLGFCIAFSNVNVADKILGAIALVFVFGIMVVFVSRAVPWVNQKRANEVLAKNNLDNNFIKNASNLLDIYSRNNNKEDKVKKNNSGTAVIELDKDSDLEIITVPYETYLTVILNKYYNNIDVRDNSKLYSDGLLKMGVTSNYKLDFSGFTALSKEEIDSLYENPDFGYEAVKSVLK